MTLACAVYRTLRVKTKHHAVDNQSRARHQHRPRTAACEGGTSASGDREGNDDAYGYVWNIFWSLLRSDPCWCARKKTGERTEGVRVKDMCDMSGGRNNKHGSDMSGPRDNDRGRINSNMCMSYGMSTSSSITGERMLHRCNNGDAVAAAGGQGGGHSGGDVSNRGGGGDCEGRREATSVKNTLLALHKLAAHFNLFSRLPSLLIYMQGIDVCVDVDRHKAGDGQCSLLLNPRNSDHVHHHPRDDNHTRAHMQSHKHSHNHSHAHIYPHNHHRARTQKAVAATYMKGADEGGNQTRDNQHQHNNNASLQSRFCRLSPFHQCSLLLFIMHHQHHISTPEFRKFLRLYVRDCRDLQRVNGGEGERGGNTMSNEHGGNPSNTILPSASLYSPPHTHQYCTSTCMLARSLLGLLVIDAVDAKTKKACIHMNKRKNQNKNKNNTSNSGDTGRVDGPQNKSRSDGGDGPFDYEFGGAVGMSMGILEGMLGLSAGALSLDSGIDVGGHGRAGRAFGGKNDDENENENENDDENDGGGGGNGSGDSDGHGHGMCSDGVDSDRRGNFGGRNGADNIADNHADRDYAAQSESESDGAGCSSPGELGQNDLSRDTELACFDIRMFRADSVDRYVETDTSNGGTDRHLAASLSSPPSSAAAAPTKRVIQALLEAKLGHITDLRQEGSQPHHRQPRRYHSSLSDYAYCHPYHRQPSQHLPRSRQKQLHEQCFMHECRSIFNQSLFKAHTARAVLPCPPAAPASPSSTSASSSPSTSTSSSTSTSASVSYAGSDESTHTRKKQRLAASASVPSQDAEMDTTGDVVGDGGDAHNTAKGKSEDGSNTRKAMTRRHGGAANDEEARDSADCSAERSTFKSKDSTDTGVADAGPPLLEPRAARNEGAGVGAGAGHRNSNAHSVYPSDDSDEASSRGQREDGKNHEQQQQGGGEEVEEEDKEDKEDEALNDDVIALISLLSALSPASFNVLSSASSAPQLMQAHAPASQVGQILQHLREINESSDER